MMQFPFAAFVLLFSHDTHDYNRHSSGEKRVLMLDKNNKRKKVLRKTAIYILRGAIELQIFTLL